MTQYQPPIAPPPPGGFAPQPMMPPGAPRKSNGAAIGSLICGILGCIPFITGILAVVLGIVGIKKTKDPQVGGKGLAIAGIILGLLSIGTWALFGGTIFALFKGTEAQREFARSFVQDIAAGNVEAAVAKTDTTAISREEVADLVKKVQAWGPLTDTTIVGFNVEPGKAQVTGSATFGKTVKTFQTQLVKGADGEWKVSAFDFQ
jgi:hypothetical protein